MPIGKFSPHFSSKAMETIIEKPQLMKCGEKGIMLCLVSTYTPTTQLLYSKFRVPCRRGGRMIVRARGLTELTNKEILTSRNVKEATPSA